VSAFGAFGYGISALGYAALFFLLLAAWQGRGSGWRLVAAALVTALWAVTLVVFATELVEPNASTVTLDSVRYLAWFAVLASGAEASGTTRLIARAAQVTGLAVFCVGLAAVALDNQTAGTAAVAGGLIMPMLGMWLLGAVRKGSEGSQLRGMNYLGIGLGAVMICDVILYLQPLVSGSGAADIWLVRGYTSGLALPFIALAVTRGTRWPFAFTVSRDAAFYTTLVTAIGGYVLLAAIGGHLVRLLGGSQGDIAQMVFYVAALSLLVLLVASASLRRRLRVFLLKHFFEHKYDYREEWLRFIATLSDNAAGEDSRVAGLRAIAQIISSPAAALLLKDEGSGKLRFAASWPSDGALPDSASGLGANHRLMDLLGRRGWVVDFQDQRSGRPSREQLDLPDWLVAGGRWRLIVPMLFKDDLMGMILLEDPPGEFSLTFEDRDLLKTVARHVATHVAQHEAERRLTEARQFEAYSRLTAFLMHDLKNAAAQLQMVVTNAGRHKQNPEFIDDAIDTVANAAGRISRLIEQLGRGADGEGAGNVSLEQVAAASIERTLGRYPRPRLTVTASGLCVAAGREQLGNIIEHLIRNAQDATPPDGQIEVLIEELDGAAVVSIADTGAGMTTAFVRDRLFKPFDSTKGSKGMGIGAYQAREYARSRGGDVAVESEPGHGTTFRVVLPVSKVAAVA
jgi:putative PEP-CTERM system histidine kinase